MFHEGRPAGADLHYVGPGNQRRGRADQFSRVRQTLLQDLHQIWEINF